MKLRLTLMAIGLCAMIIAVVYLELSLFLRVPGPEVRPVAPAHTPTPEQTITISIPPSKTLTIKGMRNE